MKMELITARIRLTLPGLLILLSIQPFTEGSYYLQQAEGLFQSSGPLAANRMWSPAPSRPTDSGQRFAVLAQTDYLSAGYPDQRRTQYPD